MILDLLIQSFKEAFKISAFVIMIMMIMEFVSLFWRGKSNIFLSKYYSQVFFALVLGLIPGCVGGFTVVSMYAHGLLSFGALLGATFTGLGDDVFRMFSLMPLMVLKLSLILFVLGLAFAWIADKTPYFRKISLRSLEHIQSHADQHSCVKAMPSFSNFNFESLSFLKTTLLFLILLYLIGLISGQLTHTHSMEHINCSHGAGFELNFENISLLLIGGIAFVIIWIAEHHFLEEHLWKHTIKKHFLSIFLWTFGTLFIFGYLTHFVDIADVLSRDFSRLFIILLVAIAVGWIPQSGPHFVFILFYFNGWIPFVILLANSIVQDGHTSLILLAESRVSYIYVKAIKSLIALIIGSIFLLF